MKKQLVCIALVALGACNDGGPTASSSFGNSGLPAVSQADPTPPTVVPVNPGVEIPDGEASESDIEIIGLNRAGIRVTARCSGVTFYVPATGADYVNVWVPEIFGLKYGPNPVNEEFTLAFEPGTYRYQLAVEKKTGDPAKPIAQDDRHRGEFTVTCDEPPKRTPEPECENVWVVDQEAYTEVITVVDKEAYEEEVCTPGEPIITGYTYKMTGNNDDDARENACEKKFPYFISPAGSYELSACIPGNGAVDACVFSSDQGEEFERKNFLNFNSSKVKFNAVPECNITTPGEPICEIVQFPAVTHEETIEHPEVGHFECVVQEQ